MLKSTKFLVFILVVFFSCNDNPSITNPNSGSGGSGNGGSGNGGSGNGGSGSNDWLIPQNLVFDGGPGKDGIPALENPKSLSIDRIDFLSDDDLVLGFSHDNKVQAYPHAILDWHEIINDDMNGKKVAVTYCPLTGTGIAWDRMVDGKETTFGVSGLLYNTNLIPYDRLSDSNWCQISLKCVNGSLIGKTAESFHLIETSWKTWKEMFPNSAVVSSITGFNRNYGRYPYGEYRTNDDMLLFPVTTLDERLPAKERVLAVIDDVTAKVYRFDSFDGGTRLFADQINGTDLLIVGDKNRNFMVAFMNNLNGSTHSFSLVTNSINGAVFQDETGNQYNLFGNVLTGPDTGSSLVPITSFMAYWFSVGAFYSSVQIFGF